MDNGLDGVWCYALQLIVLHCLRRVVIVIKIAPNTEMIRQMPTELAFPGPNSNIADPNQIGRMSDMVDGKTFRVCKPSCGTKPESSESAPQRPVDMIIVLPPWNTLVESRPRLQSSIWLDGREVLKTPLTSEDVPAIVCCPCIHPLRGRYTKEYKHLSHRASPSQFPWYLLQTFRLAAVGSQSERRWSTAACSTGSLFVAPS